MEYITQIDDIDEAAEIYETLDRIDREGACYLVHGNEKTRTLGDGLWEIKKSNNRIYYIYCSHNRVFMLHACRKQKNKAETNDIDIGKRRMKEIQARMRGND